MNVFMLTRKSYFAMVQCITRSLLSKGNDIILFNIVLQPLRLNIGQCSKMERKCLERGVGRWVPTHDMVTPNSFRMSWAESISITTSDWIPKQDLN